jgi:prevent-host-death family protein
MKTNRPKAYNVHEAKTHFSKLLERVAEGEDVVIAKAGVPVARLVPLAMPSDARVLGTESGRLTVSEDFDAPLPSDVLDSFES